MDYIKDIRCTAGFTDCTMDRLQVEQRDALAEVDNAPTGSPADRRGAFKCAAASASVMGGVMVALGTAFVLYLFMFTHSCSEGPSEAQVKFSVNCTQREMVPDQPYLVFTISRTAHYFIYGELVSSSGGEVESKFTEEVDLWQTHGDGSRSIQKRNRLGGKYVFLEKVQLHSGTNISIKNPPPNVSHCFFLFYKL